MEDEKRRAAQITAIQAGNQSGATARIFLAPGDYLLSTIHNVSPSDGFVRCQGSNGLPVITGKIELIGDVTRGVRIRRPSSAPPLRLFEVSGTGELNLDGVTLSGGLLTDTERPYGAAICNKGGSVNLRNTLVESNSGVYGFVIMGLGASSDLGIYHSVVRSNAGNAPALLNAGGRLVINGSSVSMNDGGGVQNLSGELLIANTTIDANRTNGEGGGLVNMGSTHIVNSTLSNNTAGRGDGGAIFNYSGGILTVQNSTISGNKTGVEEQAGGVMNFGDLSLLNVTITGNEKLALYAFGRVRLQNSIVASSGGQACGLGITLESFGHNLISDASCRISHSGDVVNVDPLLGPLQDNGGPTMTHATLPGSLASISFPAGGCPAADQRGALRLTATRCEIGAYTAGAPKVLLRGAARSTVGDKDNFHAGDSVDLGVPTSRWVRKLAAYIAADPGQDPGVVLDVGGENRPVGVSHYVGMPAQARITGAILQFRVKVGNLGHNDGLYFGQTMSASMQNPACLVENDPGCTVRAPLLPVIVLRDLLGREPLTNEVQQYEVNLARAPVRSVDTTQGPGGHWSARPEAYRSLLPLLLPNRQFDVVFSDDSVVDWSDLTVTFVLPGAPIGDLNGDDKVDDLDLKILTGALNTPSYGPLDPRDLDGDGRITVLDARKLMLRCTNPGCTVN